VDLVAVRGALADSITAITGLRTDGQARDSVNPPCCVIIPRDPYINYGDTMDGAITVNLSVLVIISDAAPVETTQRALDTYLGVGQDTGSASVPTAIEADNTLGGLIHYIQANNADRYGRIEYSGVIYFGARINVVIGGI
jgi:hypothetical protein